MMVKMTTVVSSQLGASAYSQLMTLSNAGQDTTAPSTSTTVSTTSPAAADGGATYNLSAETQNALATLSAVSNGSSSVSLALSAYAGNSEPSDILAIPGYAQPGLPDSTSPDTPAVAAAKAAAANSRSYSFATVAQNARTVLDAGAQRLGHAIDDSTNGLQADEIFGTMDRRSLYAVASNEGGLFSPTEQWMAQDKMSAQESNALGLPGSMSGSETQSMNAFGNAITFMENVSPEEKQSVGWAMEIANLKTAYNDFASDLNKPAQTATADYVNPLVKVLMTALKAAQFNPSKDLTFGQENTIDQIKGQPWAQGFQSQIDQAYSALLKKNTSLS
jgi:hypothetical protein